MTNRPCFCCFYTVVQILKEKNLKGIKSLYSVYKATVISELMFPNALCLSLKHIEVNNHTETKLA